LKLLFIEINFVQDQNIEKLMSTFDVMYLYLNVLFEMYLHKKYVYFNKNPDPNNHFKISESY